MGAAGAIVPVVPDENEAQALLAAAIAPRPAEAKEISGVQARHWGFLPGARIADKYVIERVIGEGGLGVVVAARHVDLGRSVAIRCLYPEAVAAAGVAERFQREARVAAKIQSDHVVHIHEVGTLPDGAPYMVMEYLAGSDLGWILIENGSLTADRAVDYILQACEALAEGHVAGIVHRDIRPSNLFIATSPGETHVLKVLDFGISGVPPEGGKSGEEESALARLAYASPEQLVDTDGVDARTDVWALGVVFYELLTETLPFSGNSALELRDAILHRPPRSLVAARPHLPTRLQAVIERCLTRNVEHRFQNVAELARELRPFTGPAGRERIDQVSRKIRGPDDWGQPSHLPPVTSEMPIAESVAPPWTGAATWAPPTVLGNVGGRSRKSLIILIAAAVVVAAELAVVLVGTLSSPPTPVERATLPHSTNALPRRPVNVEQIPGPPTSDPLASILASSVDIPPPPSASPSSSSGPAAIARPATSPTTPTRPLLAQSLVASRGGTRLVSKPVTPATPAPATPGPAKPAVRPSHGDPNAVINPFD
jgi:serine/threonine-protein kinase